jgi:hypothetical protein
MPSGMSDGPRGSSGWHGPAGRHTFALGGNAGYRPRGKLV